MIRVSMSIRAGIVILAFFSPFLFPSVITFVLGFAAALVFPPIAILIGMLTDLLYEPSGYWPLASVIGLVFCLLAIIVRSFVKARIM